MMYATVGRGRERPHGARVEIVQTTGRVQGYAAFLMGLGRGPEEWFSASVFAGDHRAKENWEFADAIGMDIDWHVGGGNREVQAHAPPDGVAALEARLPSLPGNLFHFTPHGGRSVFVLDERCLDGNVLGSAWLGAAAMTADALAGSGYRVDDATKDLARFYWTPRALVKGYQRSAEIRVLRVEPYTLTALVAATPLIAEPTRCGPGGGEGAAVSSVPRVIRFEGEYRRFKDAAQAYVARNGRRYPKGGWGRCPVCCVPGDRRHCVCWGEAASDPTKWCCWNSDHASITLDGKTIGTRQRNGHFLGDVLDLDAYEARKTPKEYLQSIGLLAREVAR